MDHKQGKSRINAYKDNVTPEKLRQAIVWSEVL